MLIISIDPGINGAICFFEDGVVKDVIEMPTMAEGKKNKRQVNGRQMFNELTSRIKGYNIKDINVVVKLKERKIVAYSKGNFSDVVYNTQNRFFNYLMEFDNINFRTYFLSLGNQFLILIC